MIGKPRGTTKAKRRKGPDRGGYSDFEVQPGLFYVAFEGNGMIARLRC